MSVTMVNDTCILNMNVKHMYWCTECRNELELCFAGSNNDGGIWANSSFGQSLESGTADVPPPKLLPGTENRLPCALVGDEAFPLKSYLMRPYPRKSLNDSRRIFNYRLSRARRTIENAFGIFVSWWRILRRSIQCKEETAHKIVLAVVVLHNFIIFSNRHSTVHHNLWTRKWIMALLFQGNGAM